MFSLILSQVGLYMVFDITNMVHERLNAHSVMSLNATDADAESAAGCMGNRVGRVDYYAASFH
jgi:hypothetical protein